MERRRMTATRRGALGAVGLLMGAVGLLVGAGSGVAADGPKLIIEGLGRDDGIRLTSLDADSAREPSLLERASSCAKTPGRGGV